MISEMKRKQNVQKQNEEVGKHPSELWWTVGDLGSGCGDLQLRGCDPMSETVL